MLGLAGWALGAMAQDGPGEWGWRRFNALETLAQSIARDHLPPQETPFHAYVNWRQLDGDGLVDAIVLIKSARASCASTAIRCMAAVVTTGRSAQGAGDYGVLGQFFPQNGSLYINARDPAGVRMWIPEDRSNYVAVILPRAAGQDWQASNDRVTQRQAMGTAGTTRIDENDFAPLDMQRRAIDRLRARSPVSPPPGGAPFLYSGEQNFFRTDPAARTLQMMLDRMASSRIIDRAPTIDATPCVGGTFGSPTSFGQYLARGNAVKVREMEVNLCSDRMASGVHADDEAMLRLVWGTRLWFATMQVVESIYFQELDQAAESSQIGREFLAAARAIDELQRQADSNFDQLMTLYSGLQLMAKYASTDLAKEVQQFARSRIEPARIAILCSARTDGAAPEIRREVMQTRAQMQDDCSRLNRAVTAMR